MTIQTGMMIAFILALFFSLWKLYAFLPNKPLHDDDRTVEAEMLLCSIMIETILEHHMQPKALDLDRLFELMKSHPQFDQQQFWRFNTNRLNQILIKHAARYPEQNSIAKIYERQKI
jgi:hypothetical protein